MRVTELVNEGLKREYEFEIEEDKIFEQVENKLLEDQPKIYLKGFRSGRVPIQILRKRFGPSYRIEILQRMVNEAVAEHLKDSGDRPASTPVSKFMPDGEVPESGLVFQVRYECLPNIPPIDLGDLKIEKLVAKPDQGYIDKQLKMLAESNFDIIDHEKGHAVEGGDLVVIDYKMLKEVDGIPNSKEDLTIEIGSGSIEGEEDNKFLGAKVGDIVNIVGNFSQERSAESIDAELECVVKRVCRKSPPEIDDKFGEKLGKENLDGLLSWVSQESLSELTEISNIVFKKNLIDALTPKLDFDVPETFLEKETTVVENQIDRNKSEISDEEKSRLALRRLRLGLYYTELARHNGFGVSDAEIDQNIRGRSNTAQEYKQLVALANSNRVFRQSVANNIIAEKAEGYITELVEVEEKEVDCDTLVQAYENQEI